MARLFLSYRSTDTGPYAGRLADRLGQSQFEAVFQDREAIGVGDDFADRIRGELARCVAVLVLIGKGWLDARDGSGARRLDDPKDWVRREVSLALALDLVIVPVLLDGTPPLRASELPADIAAVAGKNAYHFDGRYFERDADDLARSVEQSLVRAARSRGGLEVAAVPASATSLLHQLRVIWIVLAAITVGASVAPLAVPALPHQFWLFPAAMTFAAFTWWLYWLAAALPASRTKTGWAH